MSEVGKETKKSERDWEWLALTDHYHTAVAIREALREGDVEDARLSFPGKTCLKPTIGWMPEVLSKVKDAGENDAD